MKSSLRVATRVPSAMPSSLAGRVVFTATRPSARRPPVAFAISMSDSSNLIGKVETAAGKLPAGGVLQKLNAAIQDVGDKKVAALNELSTAHRRSLVRRRETGRARHGLDSAVARGDSRLVAESRTRIWSSCYTVGQLAAAVGGLEARIPRHRRRPRGDGRVDRAGRGVPGRHSRRRVEQARRPAHAAWRRADLSASARCRLTRTPRRAQASLG